jgi:hypothetical protein
MCRKGTDLYVGNSNKLFRSSDSGLTWSQIYTAYTDPIINIVSNGTSLFINGYYNILQSTDNGISWQFIPNSGLPTFYNFSFISDLNSGLYACPHSYGSDGEDVFYGLYKFQSGTWIYMTDTVPHQDQSFMEYNGYIIGGANSGLVKTNLPVIITDISDKSLRKNIFVYPNPSTGSFTFILSKAEAQSTTECLYSIINELGQTIQTFKLNSANNYSANIENLSNGIYFIVGFNKDQLIRQKVIVTQ